jgi:RNA recognition motif-containing protein
MPTVFVRARGTTKRVTPKLIVDFFGFYGIDASDCKIIIPKWPQGALDAGQPRNFGFVEFRDVARAEAALAHNGKILDGVNFEVKAARQGNYLAAKPRVESSSIQPHGENFKLFTENDFRR